MQERGPSQDRVRRAHVRLHARAPGRRPGDQPGPVPVDPRSPATPRSATRSATRSRCARSPRRSATCAAVDDVSFTVQRGKTHALVGESGSGKTTAVRLLLGLEQPDAGEIVVGDAAVSGHSRTQWRSVRRHLQLVYQNPFTSLDPTWRLERIVREPLDRYRVGDKARASRARRRGAATRSACPRSCSPAARRTCPAASASASRSPGRWCMRPDVLVLDEPTSALDVTVQAGDHRPAGPTAGASSG